MKSKKKIEVILLISYVLFSSIVFLNNFKNNPVDKEDSKTSTGAELKGADSSYILMINDGIDSFPSIPNSQDINITTVEVDDNSTHVLFRMNVSGSIVNSTGIVYLINLDYDQNMVADHYLYFIGGGPILWDMSIILNDSYYSGNSLVFIVPKSIQTDPTFNISAQTSNGLSTDYAPGSIGQWSDLYSWQVGVGIENPYLTGDYLDYGVDTNSDGKFEYLAINVTINATIAGNYKVYINYLTNSTDLIYVSNVTDAGYLAIGKYNITVFLLGSEIFRSKINGPYTLFQVHLEHDSSIVDSESYPYITSFYSYNQFGAPPAYFTDTYSDAGVDLNGNELFEYLNFSIEVNITHSGSYTVRISILFDPLENPIYVFNSTTAFLEVGIQTISVCISGTDIFSSGIDGPYTILYLTLEDSYFNELDSRTKPYTTINAYLYTDFEIPEDFEYPIDFNISPENATLSFGGQTTFTIYIWSKQSIPDIATINISGISTEWYTVTTPVYLLPYGFETVQLLISIPDVGAMPGNYIMNISVKSSNFNISKSINVNVTVQTNPIIYALTPLDNDHLASNNVVFIWKTSCNCTTEVYLRKNSEPFTQYTDSGYTKDHSLIIGGLDNNTWYDFYVSSLSTAGYRTNSSVRSFYIEPGVVFTQRVYDFAIERDYDQNLTVTVKNLGDVPRQFLMTIYSIPPDLILGFVGEGSMDKIISLNPGQTLDVSLIVHAQDAMLSNYEITLELINLGASPEENDILDYAVLNLTLKELTIDFTITEIDDDPHTLTKTFNLTNYGNTITDFKVYMDYKLEPLITWDPKINHLRLETGESIIIKANLNVDWSFNGSRSGRLFVEAFNTIKNISVNFVGDGEIFYGCSDASYHQEMKDWFCTNKPSIEMEFDVAPNINPVEKPGSLTFLKGTVLIDGKPAKIWQIIKAGSFIKTGKESQAEITLPDGSIIRMDENTEISTTHLLSLKTPKKGIFEMMGNIYLRIERNIKTMMKGKEPTLFYEPLDVGEYEIVTPTAVTGVRGTYLHISYDPVTKTTEVIVYEGHVDLYNQTTGLESSISTDPEFDLTYNIIREYNASSVEYDLIFRNSTDLGQTWLVNQTLFSSPDLANITLAVGPNNTIFVVYEVLNAIYCIISRNNGSSWSSPTMLASNDASEPFIQASLEIDNVFVGWSNSSSIKPGIYFRETRDAGKTWRGIKRGPSYAANALEAYLEVNFSLPWPRETYRKHDVVISVNDHIIAMLNDTIPEGTYIFPIDLNYLNYGTSGLPASNKINFDTYHMNIGHYVVSTDCRLIIRLGNICIPVYAYSQKEADEIVRNLTIVNFNANDIGVYVNTIEAPTDMKQGEQTTINATIMNIGDNEVTNVIVQFYQGNPNQGGSQIGIDQIIPSIMPGENATVSMVWTHPGGAINYIYVNVTDGTENYTKNNLGFRHIVLQKPPTVTITFPNSTVLINNTKYITWQAEDPNYDFLLFSVYYGNVTHWNLIVENIDKLFYLWNTTMIPNGDYKILVNATDGFFIVNDTSDEFFTVRNMFYPVADAGTIQEVTINTMVNFDGSGSWDDIGIVEYFWDFGDGFNATGMTVSHKYTLKPGENWLQRVFAVSLTVTDTDGLKDTDTIFITVNNPEVVIISGDDDDEDDEVLKSEEITIGWFTVDPTTAAILIGTGISLAIFIPLILIALVRPELFLISKKRRKEETEKKLKRKAKKKVKKKIKEKLKKRKIVFIDLIYPPVALKNEPFNLYCFLGQRFTKNITIDANVLHSVEDKKKKELFEKGKVLSLESLNPRLLSFQVSAGESTKFSFKVVVTAIKGKKLKKKFDKQSKKFEVKVLSLDEEQTRKDLEMLYQTIDNEEKELIGEFQEYISEFNVKSLDQVIEKISLTDDLKKFSDRERELGKSIKFIFENLPKIQDLSISEVNTIRDELLSIYEQIFILTKRDIRIKVPEEIEVIKDIKPYSKAWLLFKSIMLKRLQKVEILKALYETRRVLIKAK